MPNKNKDINPDLIEAVDALLEDIEETTKSYAPEEEKEIDSSALLNDVGEVIGKDKSPPDPIARIDDDATTSSESDNPEVVDSIENAKQALDALEDVESQAEELVAQSVDALLENAEAAADIPPAPAAPTTEPPPSDGTPSDPEIQDETEVSEQTDEAPSAEAEYEVPPEPEAQENSDTEMLLDSIDKLLENAESEDQESTPEPNDETPSEPEAVVDEIESAAPEAPAPADEQETQAPEPETPSAPEPVAAPETETETEVEVEAETETETEAPVQSAPQTDEAALTTERTEPAAEALDESMDMLDSALAEAADDMLEGDFETEDGELVSGEAVASAIEAALEAQPKPGSDKETANEAADAPAVADNKPATAPAPTKQTPAPKQAATQAAEPVDQTTEQASGESDSEIPDSIVQSEIEALEEIKAKEPYRVPAWFERAVEIVRPKVDKIDPLKGKTMDTIAMVLGAVLVTVMTKATPIAARVMILVSKPLANKSPELRNAIGYVALWTGFLAIMVWAYLLMFRTANIPHPDTAPTRVISVDEALKPDPSTRAEP